MEKGGGNKEKCCFLRDSSGRFMRGNRKRNYELNENVEGGDGEELSLGLSLNGKFGVDPKKPKILNRSSSVLTGFVVPGHDKKIENENQFSIIRTSSLPMKTEEESELLEEEKNKFEKMKKIIVVKENAEKNVNSCSNIVEACGKSLKSSRGLLLGTGSSGVAKLESKPPLQGVSGGTDVLRPPISGRSMKREQKLVAIALETVNEKAPAVVVGGKNRNEAKEKLRKLLLKMPCVSTRVGRPYGKEVEGFLYAYRKGEEVKIVCVCHGRFLTPAEFVRHAGGGDVENPLRHIIIHRAPL